MFSKALYYPTIDISDEDWLKTAYLFWDGIRTIVPESMADNAYRNNTTMYLAEEGFLEPVFVGTESKFLRPLVKVVKDVSGDRFMTQADSGGRYLPPRADGLPCSLNDSSAYTC